MGQVLVNPDNPEQTFTVGQRGRKPAWVLPLLEDAGIDTTPKIKEPEPVEKSGLVSWTLPGIAILVAEDILEAIRMFNRTSNNPINSNELRTFWKYNDNEDQVEKGVWVLKDNEWQRRPELVH